MDKKLKDIIIESSRDGLYPFKLEVEKYYRSKYPLASSSTIKRKVASALAYRSYIRNVEGIDKKEYGDKIVSINMDRELWDIFGKLADALGRTRSEIIRELVRGFIEKAKKHEKAKVVFEDEGV